MKFAKYLVLFFVIFALCVSFTLGLCSCDDNTTETDTSNSETESTVKLPNLEDYINPDTGYIEFPKEEFQF